MLTNYYNSNTGNVIVAQLIAVAFITISTKCKTHTYVTLPISIIGISITFNSNCYHHVLSGMCHVPVYIPCNLVGYHIVLTVIDDTCT